VQLTTDGYKPYSVAVEDAFGADIDYAQLVKICGAEVGPKDNVGIRYSPAQCMGSRKAVIPGQTEYRHKLEAGAGIEPTYRPLQSRALALGYPAVK
jgi:hypothetical protein